MCIRPWNQTDSLMGSAGVVTWWAWTPPMTSPCLPIPQGCRLDSRVDTHCNFLGVIYKFHYWTIVTYVTFPFFVVFLFFSCLFITILISVAILCCMYYSRTGTFPPLLTFHSTFFFIHKIHNILLLYTLCYLPLSNIMNQLFLLFNCFQIIWYLCIYICDNNL